MNEKITPVRLSGMMAAQTGFDRKVCEEFVRRLFARVAKSLETEDSVKVRGLGTFRVVEVQPRKSVDVASGRDIEIAGHSKVTFTPARELASAVNAPFEAFEWIELPDNISEEDLIGREELAEAELTEDREDAAGEPEQKDQSSQSAHSSHSAQNAPISLSALSAQSSPIPETEPAPETEPQISPITPEAPGKSFGSGFLTGFICCAVVAVAGYLIFSWVHDDKTQTVPGDGEITATASDRHKATGVAPGDAAIDADEEVPTLPSDAGKPAGVVDTITRTRYLTTMAKEHYGNFNLWPYIYEENKAFLGHPDRIRPGTPVVVPSLSKYGVDPKDPEQIKIAKKKGLEIYSRYR